MAQQFFSPFPQFVDSTGAPLSGGTLTFYESGTSTPLATYSDEDRSTANSNPLTLDSLGRPSSHIFLQDQDYKVVLKDSSGNTIWTADPVRGTDFDYTSQDKVGSGDPNGSVAGTAGSAGVLPTRYWDFTNKILYICTTTGSSSTAAWTAINASAATPVVTPPQGYLTLVSGTPIITSDQSAKTAVYYTPHVGNQVPIYDGSKFTPTTFSELTLDLVSAHSASTLYDVFVFSNSGVLTLVTGPAWSTSTAGSGARGSGAATTELQRVGGLYVNAVSMTGRNGNDTYSIGANLATYLGTIAIDGSAGQVSCHVSYGQSRKFGVWNAYNRRRLWLKAGDSSIAGATTTTSYQPIDNDSNNKLTVLAGLAEEMFDLQLHCRGTANADATSFCGIGYNSTSAASGIEGGLAVSVAGGYETGTGVARHLALPALGIQDITALYKVDTGSQVTLEGGEDGNVLSAVWMG